MGLKVHTKIEEEDLYLTGEKGSKELKEMVFEAYEEHHMADVLLAEIEGMAGGGEEETLKAKMATLQEMIEHHVEEEEKEMFPKAKKEIPNLDELGRKMWDRRQALEAELRGGLLIEGNSASHSKQASTEKVSTGDGRSRSSAAGSRGGPALAVARAPRPRAVASADISRECSSNSGRPKLRGRQRCSCYRPSRWSPHPTF